MFWGQGRGRGYNRRCALLIAPRVPYRAFTDTILHCAADIISTVEFDSTGNYLATGDKGGRVVLFERNESVRFRTTSLIPLAADGGCDQQNSPSMSIIHRIEKRLRVQVLYRVSITRTRV